GRGDDDRIDVLLLLEHLAKIGVPLRLAVGLLELDHRLVGTAVAAFEAGCHFAIHKSEINIDERYQVLTSHHQLTSVGLSLTSAANESKVKRVARRAVTGPPQHVARNDHCAEGSTRGAGNEPSSRNLIFLHFLISNH